MVVGVVLLGVVCLALVVVVGLLVSARSNATTQIETLTTELDEQRNATQAATTRADEAEAAKLAATARAESATRDMYAANDRAASAEHGRDEARTQASDAQADAEAARAEVALADAARAEAESRADDAVAEREQLAELLHPDGAWALDHLRIERLWRDRLSLPGEQTSPLAALDDPEQVGAEALRSAVHVLTEASREEIGVVIDLTWKLDDAVSPAVASAVVRLVEELVAVARESDGGELVVHADEGSIVLRLTTEPAVEVPAALADAVARFGWSAAAIDDALEARIPLTTASS